MTDAARWNRLKAIFSHATDLDTAHREPYITETCGADLQLRRELESMLQAHDNDAAFLTPIVRTQAATRACRQRTAPSRVGLYEIIELIAEGGMGEVYLARRADDSFQKHVAVKILRHSMATAGMLERFHRERQTLASLEHPNISRLLDGGTTEDGLPFLVMEYIAGKSIVNYANDNGLGVQERLLLFRTVCSAVTHAHHNLIVHRDIKPSNILVSDAGDVKLLDFGVSRLIEQERHGQLGRSTTTETAVMTPAYSSPEQLRGEPVTTATDVYSLGVVLYELLSDRRPFRLNNLSRYEATRVICNVDAELPSAAVRARAAANGGAPAEATEELRNGQKRSDSHSESQDRVSWHRTLRGDLDNIVLMSLRKDPLRRYQTVEQFSDDIDRYFDGQPVIAREDTLAYRTNKFLRRNRLQVAAGAIAGLAVGVAMVAISVGFLRARESERLVTLERNTATAARQESQGVIEFLETMLGESNPYYSSTQGDSVVGLLDQTNKLIEANLPGQPAVQARVRLAVGRTYTNLLMFEDAIPHLQIALEYYRANCQSDDPVLADCLDMLGLGIAEEMFKGVVPSVDAEVLQREALAIRRKHFGEEHELVAQSLSHLAGAVWARGRSQPPSDQVVQLFQDSLSMSKRLGLERSSQAAFAQLGLAQAWFYRKQTLKAEQLFIRAIDTYERLPRANHRRRLEAMKTYALLLQSVGRADQAVELLESYLDIAPKGVPLRDTEEVIWRMLFLKLELGKPAEAEETLHVALQIACELLRKENPQFEDRMNAMLFELKTRSKDRDRSWFLHKALPLFLEARSAKPDEVFATVRAFSSFVNSIDGRDAAIELLEDCRHSLKDALPKDHVAFRNLDSQIDYYAKQDRP